VEEDHATQAALVRRAVAKIDSHTVLAEVDSLDLSAKQKIGAAVGVPLRNLRQRRDVVAFARAAPNVAVRTVLELLAASPLEKVVALLGEHAESPSYEQLAEAVDQLVADGATADDVVALLVYAVSERFPSAPHCRRLLEERPELALPELPASDAPRSLLTPKVVDPEIRERRRARRAAQKGQRRPAPSTPPHGIHKKGG
jgi:hypothetical protein